MPDYNAVVTSAIERDGAAPPTTEQRLVAAAERLFAERGIDAVSLRAVMTEAGTNVASVHYHFGSKDALISAVVRRRSEAVASRRAALLDAMESAGDPTPRGLAEAFVLPVWELACGEGASWVKFIAGILAGGHQALALVSEGFTDQAVRFTSLMGRIDPDLPRPTVRFRLAQAMTLTFHALGDLHSTRDLVALSGVDITPEQAKAELIDVVTAILTGPPDSPRSERKAP